MSANPTFDDLSPDQQEVLCAEFLRTPMAGAHGLPTLASLTVPTGRTMRDIDIIGVTATGGQLVAQVTYSNPERVTPKVEALRRFLPESTCVLFCNCAMQQVYDGIILVPIRDVFNHFTADLLGKVWLERSFSI